MPGTFLAQRSGMRARGCWLVALLSAIGCGGSVVTAPGSDTGGAGGTAVTGSGGTPATGAGGGSSGSANICARTHGHASISVTSMNGAEVDCYHVTNVDGGAPPLSTAIGIDGQIEDVTPTSFKINTCPPNANCVNFTTFKVQAPGLALALPAGTFVQVHYAFSKNYTCTQAIEVDSLAAWAGLPNPEPLGNRLLLAVVDGAFGGSKTDNSVYEVHPAALGCDPDAGAGCGGPKPDEYALDFAPVANPGHKVRVYMGKTKTLDLMQTQAPSFWRITNLRSYQTTACDDYWNFAWTITWQPPVK